MAVDILTPQETEHPTEDELVFLVKHIGHDIRGDLTVIDAAFYNISNGALETTDMKDSAKALHRRTRHVTHILNAIEILGRGKKSYNEFSLNTTLSLLVHYIEQRQPELMFKREVRGRIHLKSNEDALYMQLLNFVQNAVDCYRDSQGIIHQRGTIVVGAEIVHLTGQELAYLGRNKVVYTTQNEFVRTFVTDEGSGITDIKKAFEPGTTSKMYGSGLGLSLADYVCDYLHGFVKVETEERGGSTFSLYVAKERKERKDPWPRVVEEKIRDVAKEQIQKVPFLEGLYRRWLGK